MRRREFIAGIGIAAASRMAADVRQATPVIGLLINASPDGYALRCLGNPKDICSGRVLPTLNHAGSGRFGGASSKRVAEQPTARGLLRWLFGPGP